MDIVKNFDKAYESMTPAELAEAPVSAISGITEADAENLKAAFDIETVRDLAENKYFKIAQEVVALADAK